MQVGPRDLDVDAGILLRLMLRVQHPQRLAPVAGPQAGLFARGRVLQIPCRVPPKNPIPVHADPLVERIEPADPARPKTVTVWQTHIDPNTNRHNGTATNPHISHYGYSDDATPDTNSNKRKLGAFGPLGPYSLAISDNVARTNGLIRKKPVYANGQFFGIYGDRAPESNTIDVYDPQNRAGSQDWGGIVKGGVRISSSPK